MTDFLTVLRARSGARLTKAWRANPEGLAIAGYEDAKTFDATRIDVPDLHGLHASLQGLRDYPDRCVIRGAYPPLLEAGDGACVQRVLRRVEETVDTPHHWVMIDVDEFVSLADPVDDPAAACAEFIEEKLPREFMQRAFVWQLSASAGAPDKLHLLKAHLWFWLAEPVDSRALRQWAKGWGTIDAAVFRQVQPHYVADPIFEGVDDPVPQRLGVAVSGTRDEGPVPISFLGAIAPIQSAVADAEDADLTKIRGSVAGYDIDRVRDELLTELSPDDGHDPWLEVGMALHHQFDGSDEALELWDEWSSEGGTYRDGECAERWKSFTGDRTAGTGAVTLRALLKRTKDKRDKKAAVQAKREANRKVSEAQAVDSKLTGALAEWTDKVNASESARAIETQLCPVLRLVEWTDADRSALAETIHAKCKALGAPVDRRTVKKWIKPPVGDNGAATPASWTKDWVYVSGQKAMYNRTTRTTLDRTSFDQQMTHLVPLVGQQTVPQPAWSYLMQFDKPAAVMSICAPTQDAVFEVGGQTYVNLWRPDRVPALATDAEYAEAAPHVAAVVEWFTTVFPDQREREILLSWLAHNARTPGVKVGWSPYIYSRSQGVGKTALSHLMAAIMGGGVGYRKGAALSSRFSGWEVENALVLLDEFTTQRATNDGVDPAENLKVLITGHTAAIERKGVDTIEAPTYCNVMLAANNLHGIRVTDQDRRLFYVSSPLDGEEAKALVTSRLFDRVYDAMRYAPGALRRWLLELPVHPEFGVQRRAPETNTRSEAIEESKSDLRSEVEDLLEEGGPGYCWAVVSTQHLRAAVVAQAGARREQLGRRAIEMVLRELGFKSFGQAKLAGKVTAAWALDRSLTAPEVREKLRSTIEKAVDDAFMD